MSGVRSSIQNPQFRNPSPIKFFDDPAASGRHCSAVHFGKDELCGEQCVKHANFALHFVYSPIFRMGFG